MDPNKDQEPEIEVKEAVDGSAIVELPEDLAAEVQEGQPEAQEAASDANDEDADAPDDSEALRAAKRARRKAKRELVKKTNSEKDARLAALQRKVDELTQRLSVTESKTHSADLARLDKTIEDSELRLQYARMKISEATSAGDGEALAKAQEMWYDARKQVEDLKRVRQTAATPRQQASIPDPNLQRLAANWMERNSWYKPDNKDTDSKIAKQIDESLTAEGWDPTSEEYWDELDNRLQRYLPHRYNQQEDETPSRRSRPRNIVTGSGRESSPAAGGRNTITLSPEQVRAMKDAGMWDDPQKRAKMIKRYAQEARNYRS
jgi:hypothetical protein